jgi:type 1 glutamine amidotransferase
LTELKRDNKENLQITTTVQELPVNWRSKKNAKGQVYYYNTVTNATTYNLEEVKASVLAI